MALRRRVNALYSLCLRTTSRLLIRSYWGPDITINPFEALPSDVVHDLITYICLKTGRTFQTSYILLLLKSGRVTNLKIHDVKLNLSKAEAIFDALMPFSRRLKSIQLVNINVSFGYYIPVNFSSLLRKAKSLECLETCIRFKLEDIAYCFYLQKLVLDFDLYDTISSFHFVQGDTPINHSLKVFNVPRFQLSSHIHFDIAKLLLYYVELIETDCEVTRSILYLHEKRLYPILKLQKSVLGDEVGATKDGIIKTSQYCPDLAEVTLSPIDYFAIHCLDNFSHITSLTICEPTMGSNDYHLGIRPLLENGEFGPNLKTLKIVGYTKVSISSIGACCTILEELRLESISEDYSLPFVPHSYENLLSLFVETVNQAPCRDVSLIGCLSNAVALEFLTIRNASMLTDSVLSKILENSEALSNMKAINIPLCGLSISGLRELARRFKALDYIVMNSATISREDASELLKSLKVPGLNWIGP